MNIKHKSFGNIKKIFSLFFCFVIILCSLSACSESNDVSERKKNSSKTILGKWYNEKGDCLEILSDNTYSIDKIYTGYEIGIDSGKWEYLKEEDFFKFYANNYDESVIKVEIDNDKYGTCIEYTYYGIFYKNEFPSKLIEEQNKTENKPNDYVKCPNFVGMSVSEIQEHKYFNDSTLLFTFEYVKSDEYNINCICEQSIEPETQIKKGSVITLHVSTGASEIIIPNIYFMSETEAVNLIRNKGFRTKVEYIADSDIENGKVIKTSPEIGTKVTKNQTITIYVSNGNEQNYVPVPDVIGITRPVAIAKLESNGFTVKTIMQHNENYDHGFVFKTDPVPGTNLAEGKNITIYVSLGKADK